MSKFNSILICLFAGFFTLYGNYNYVFAEEQEQIPATESEPKTDTTLEPREDEETNTEIDELLKRMDESYEQENSPEYKAQQEEIVKNIVASSSFLSEHPEIKSQDKRILEEKLHGSYEEMQQCIRALEKKYPSKKRTILHQIFDNASVSDVVLTLGFIFICTLFVIVFVSLGSSLFSYINKRSNSKKE